MTLSIFGSPSMSTPFSRRNGARGSTSRAGGAALMWSAFRARSFSSVEDAGGAADVLQVEHLDEFLLGEELLVAVGPSQPHQVVDQGLRQKTHVAVGGDRGGAVALAQAGAVPAEHHGDMAEQGQRAAEGLVELDLFGGVHHVVVAPDDGVDPHGDVVHHHREVVGGAAVAAADDEIVQLIVPENDVALDDILQHRGAGERGLETHHRRVAAGQVLVAAGPVILRFAAGGQGLRPHLFNLLGRAGAVIGVAGVQQFLDVLQVDREAPGLEVGPVVPVQAEPLQGLEDGIDRGSGRACRVRVFDAQDELAFHAAGVEPVEQGRPRPADVQIARRARGKACHHLCHGISFDRRSAVYRDC